jgi:hypothetical protein
MKNVAIVDPYSSGNLFAKRLRQMGFQTTAIHSHGKVLDCYQGSFVESDFDFSFGFEEFLSSHTQKDFTFSAVFAGIESGVHCADFLAAKFDLVGNSPSSSDLRRNKHAMHAALRSAGVRSCRQMLVRSLQDARDVHEALNVGVVVVKPLSSAGTDGVTRCDSVEAVENAWNTLAGQASALGGVNNCLLAQEFLDGTEYMVDSVSWKGESKNLAFCKLDKRKFNDSAFCYFQLDTLPLDSKDEMTKSILEYNAQVLKAVGIEYGASHSEIIVDSKGPCLVEVGARVHGGGTPVDLRECYSNNQIDETIACYVNGVQFAGRIEERVTMNKKMRIVFSVSERIGEFGGFDEAYLKEKVRSLKRIKHIATPRNGVRKTTDVFSCPGWFVLFDESEDQIESDTLLIREYLSERHGLR